MYLLPAGYLVLLFAACSKVSISYSDVSTHKMDKTDGLMQNYSLTVFSETKDFLHYGGVTAVSKLLKNALKIHKDDMADYYAKKGDYNQARYEFLTTNPEVVKEKPMGVEGFVEDLHITVRRGSKMSFTQTIIDKQNGEKKIIILYKW